MRDFIDAYVNCVYINGMSVVSELDLMLSAPELANRLEISARALRFYESKGLITPNRVGNTRVYNHKDYARLQLILRGKRLGFSLADIREFLDLYDADPTQRSQLRLLQQKVSDQIQRLQNQRVDLDRTLTELIEIQQVTEQALTRSSPT